MLIKLSTYTLPVSQTTLDAMFVDLWSAENPPLCAFPLAAIQSARVTTLVSKYCCDRRTISPTPMHTYGPCVSSCLICLSCSLRLVLGLRMSTTRCAQLICGYVVSRRNSGFANNPPPHKFRYVILLHDRHDTRMCVRSCLRGARHHGCPHAYFFYAGDMHVVLERERIWRDSL